VGTAVQDGGLDICFLLKTDILLLALSDLFQKRKLPTRWLARVLMLTDSLIADIDSSILNGLVYI
jgi:hypothetical protein